MNCCAEGFYADADRVARWAATTVSPTRRIVAYTGSGLVETVRFALMRHGLNPTLVHPYWPQFPISQLSAYDEIYVVVRRPKGNRTATDRVAPELHAAGDSLASLFGPAEAMAAFSVTDVFRMRRRPAAALVPPAPLPFNLMEYPR